MAKGIGESVVIDGIGNEIGGRFYGRFGIAHGDTGSIGEEPSDIGRRIGDKAGDRFLRLRGNHWKRKAL